MIEIDLMKLFARLSPLANRAIERASALCSTRTNYNIEVEHWICTLLEQADSDFVRILESSECDVQQTRVDMTRVLDKMKTGNAKQPPLSPDIVDVTRDAWTIASIDFGSSQIRSGHLMIALLANSTLRRTIVSASKQFDKVNVQSLRKSLVALCADTAEDREATILTQAGWGSDNRDASSRPSSALGSTPALDQYTIDLTAKARDGKIDAVLGRDSEIRQVIDILMRRRQNNPIVTGEAGVGKTAIAEGFALRIASGDVPEPLKEVSLRSLDMGLLQAGAGVKGEFENRLKTVIEEVKASPKPVILFVDEAHTLIGAGGTAGQGDAANLLKPALARGELRTIAATTWAEYKKYFEKDAALARRFQVVKVDEPSEEVAIDMVRGLTKSLEKHHQVTILDEAIIDAVKLSSRYISGRQLPDKAIGLIDTSCARVGLSQSTSPPALEDAIRKGNQLKLSREILERETLAGASHSERIAELDEQIQKTEETISQLTQRWDEEKAMVSRIHEIRSQLFQPETSSESSDKTTASLTQELVQLEKELNALQKEDPLVHPYVNQGAIAETVASWTGIPVGRMLTDEINTVLNLQTLLERNIVGQSHALKRIAQSIQTSRAKLNDPRTPIGVFLLAGTSGVGKTETAIALAELLYGGEQNMTVINMSEFKEEHKVSLLMGSPPGYVGYGEGGVLTEAVRRKPYSVILLDEMEKAHPGVQDIFYQVFDKGNMKDGEGRDIDFKNTLILMTTNAGTDVIKSLCSDPDTTPEPDDFVSAIFPEMLKTFKPAFMGRLTMIPYYPLTEEVIKRIARLKLNKIGRRLHENYKAAFEYSDEVLDSITSRCSEVDTGARNIDHIINKSLLPKLSSSLLAKLAEGKEISNIRVSLADSEFELDIS